MYALQDAAGLDLLHLVGASRFYLVGNAVRLLCGPNSCGRDLEAHLTALGKEYVGGLLCVGLELSLHGLDVVVGFCLELGGGRSAGTARRQDSAIELLLLLTPVRINEGLGIDPVFDF